MLSARIREIRVARGLSQRKVAEGAKVTRPYLTMLESGQRRSCSLAVLQRLAKALGVPVGRLIE